VGGERRICNDDRVSEARDDGNVEPARGRARDFTQSVPALRAIRRSACFVPVEMQACAWSGTDFRVGAMKQRARIRAAWKAGATVPTGG